MSRLLAKPFVVRASARIGVCTVVLCLSTHLIASDSPAPLPDAAEQKDWSRVTALLQSKADPNSPQPDGATALHWAAYHDQATAARKLLAAGAKPDITNRYGVTPLSLACTNGNETLVGALLDAGADANAVLRGGETALMTAARTGRVGPVQQLLAKGAHVEAKDRKGQTALMWAAAEGHTDVIDLLLKSGAGLHTRLKSGFTPLLFAVREGRIEAVRTLLKAGADPKEAIVTSEKTGGREASAGTSALIFAVENGHFELAMLLVKAGADPDDQRSGFTALHTLSWVRRPSRGDDEAGQPPPDTSGSLTSLDFVRQIVAAGANVNAKLSRRTTSKGRLGMGGATPFLLAAKTADMPLMKLLVKLGADPLQPNDDGCTPLMAAAGIGTYAPDEDAGTEDECLAAVEHLLSLGATVNTVDKLGETAMHGAAYKSLPRMVNLLAAKGADISVWNQKNKNGWTPLLIAQGFRAGNFKPSAGTEAAISSLMRTAGITPPPPPDRPAVGARQEYQKR
uniref:Ankyrin-related protein n=1 Tax=uncultured Verrucomicrobiota bacterium TaxID=156588 RepID=D2DXV9_9BACT|nr:ankyrin-related protein [uncultured Verrucomicrobiota bacterium]